MDPEYEHVYTVNEYYDGPREGVADFQGTLHVYKSRFNDFKGYIDSFQLMPISPENLKLILEDWAIWKRWETAYYAGSVTLETHPALPEERTRHDELKPLIENALRIDEAISVEARGDFIRDNDDDTYHVRWIILSNFSAIA